MRGQQKLKGVYKIPPPPARRGGRNQNTKEGKRGRRREKKERKGNGNRNGWGMGREGKVGKKCTGRIGFR